jgi:3-hydroxybutyryl-CoA dehydrogenase
MENEMVAVIGAGIMGCDIALELASYGYSVALKDIDENILKQAESTIRENFKFSKLMKPRFAKSSSDDLLAKVSFDTDYENFRNVNFIIENITEDYTCKESLYLELRDICSEDIIFGVNTSCISITKIGALMPKPENVIGMHFMNPVPMIPLVEVIRGFHTSDETIKKTQAFLNSIEKTSVVVNDSPGFVTNRVLMLTINECIWLIQDQVAEPNDIDKIFKLGFSHKMGPLATADLIGLDTILRSINVLYESYNDPKYRPCPLLKKMVDAGLLGKKSGKGFFNYQLK